MPSSPILTASHLVKQFGALTAVNDVSFQIEAGEIFGLLGPNGAGKSTTIAMLSGLYPPTRGNVTVGAFDVAKEPMQVKRIIGVAPQELALYPTLSARDNLAFFGALYGLSGRTLQERINAVLEIVAMSERARDPVQSFSGGMKRRINLAIALINQPQLLILDEPTATTSSKACNGSTGSRGCRSSTRPTTWRRPNASAGGSPSSTAGRSSPRIPRATSSSSRAAASSR
jgi:ABC-2 type transport system ATP-binding protein